MRKFRVIVIDDDDLFLFLIFQNLKCFPFIERMDIAGNVSDALRLLEDYSQKDEFPEFIFIDHRLEEIDGISFAGILQKKFAKHFPGTDIYIISSTLTAETVEQAKKSPAVKDCLLKPITSVTIEKLINDAV